MSKVHYQRIRSLQDVKIEAKGPKGNATEVDASFKKAWARADVTLTASRF